MSTDSQILTSQIPSSLRRSKEPKNKIKLLKEVLEETGIKLSLTEDLPHILTQEQALVVRDLEKILEHSNKNLEVFIEGFQTLCGKEKQFRKGLLLTNLKKIDENQTSCTRNEKIEQESLFRILLKVACLQEPIINILLDEITTVSSESSEDTSWLRMLLNPLRYLPYIKNSDSLTSKLLDILEVATFPAQLEILDSIPEIIPDDQCHNAAQQLCKLLDENDELTGAVIDCLNGLDLDSDMRSEVQDRILAKMLSGTSLKVFPILLSFLMTDCKPANLTQTLLKVRNALDTVMSSSEKSKEKESCKIFIFNKLQMYAVTSKVVSEAWLNVVSMMKTHSDHKPVDYLILFMLHGQVQVKKKIIEAMFRKRVHAGLFRIGQIERVFERYLPQQLFKDYFGSIVEIGCSLIRSSSDKVITEYASALFSLVFSYEDAESIYRRDVLDNLIILTGTSDKKAVSTVLKIFSTLLLEKDKLQPHAIVMMRLLELLDSLELRDVKEVFEVLCSLLFGENSEDSLSGLRDEIHMIVRKQLHSTKRAVKHRGIISAVVLAKHIVSRVAGDDENVSPDIITSINKLPRGPAREAGTLLEMTGTCTINCPEHTGLYYDQLTSMLMYNNHLDKFFLAWLYKSITDGFQRTFVTDEVPGAVNGIEMSMQYSIHRPEDSRTPLGVNIAGLTLAGNSKILLLAPHFRLLRLLHYRQHDGNLDSIDALLGCSVVMPKVDLDDLESDQARQVADCLFYCANWLREVVSGFVTQLSRRVRGNVVRRLQDILDTEQNLIRCIKSIPDHKLPVSYFDSTTELNKQSLVSPLKGETTRPKGNPRKRQKTARTVTDPDETGNVAAGPSQGSGERKRAAARSAGQAGHAIRFREMDTDIILLAKYPLRFPEDDCSQYATQTATLDIDQLKFILKDFAGKLESLTRDKDVGLLHLSMVAPINIVSDGKVVLPYMHAHLKVLVKKIDVILEKSDGRLDSSEMYTQEATDVKTCFGLVIEIFRLIFSWTGFRHSSNLEVLNLLSSLRTDRSQVLNSAHRLIAEFIERISEFTDRCLELSQAVSLVETMEALHSATTPNPEVQKKIVSAAGKLLAKRWYNSKKQPESGRNSNLHVAALVKVYLSSASVKTIYGLVGTLQDQAGTLQTKDDSLDMLASIDKQNFHVFYNGLYSALLNRVKIDVQSSTDAQHLTLWSTTVRTMEGLMSISKAQETKANLVCYLKKSIGILKVFLSHGIPILEMRLGSKPDDVVAIFKAMQTNTRFLHHLCCYSKLTKDSSLMAFVPKFRLTLETFVYRVKAALAANNCSAAFWMGVLRNKNLCGEDILSQSTTVTESNVQNSEDEDLPSDDDSEDEEELTNAESGGGDGQSVGGSECY